MYRHFSSHKTLWSVLPLLLSPLTALSAQSSGNSTLSVLQHDLKDTVSVTTSQQAVAPLQNSGQSLIITEALAVVGQEHIYGKWEGPYGWPVVAIHASLLPNGKVLAFDSAQDQAAETYTEHTHTRTTVWDPISNTHSFADVALGYNFFCSGHAKLSNGHLFIAGGNRNINLDGLNTLTNYDPFAALPPTTQFSAVGIMSYDRWYPAVTPLANGEMLISGGGASTPEVRQFDGSIRQLFNITENFAADAVFHWLKAAPNGRVAYLGPSSQLRYLNTTGGGSWQIIRQRDNKYRSYGSFATYDVGKVLVAGGNTPAESTAIKIDLNTMAPSSTNRMKYARRQHNLTVLPDGTVLATGGLSGSAEDFDFLNGVYAAEVWNPATGVWTELANMQVHRAYHSTALLLPDGRVLSGGGGICGGCLENGYLNRNAEIFSPPYLFKKDGSGQPAARPSISTAPDLINPASGFSVTTPDAAVIAKVSLLRLGSVTHSVNMEQNYIPLAFTRGSGNLTITAPANNNIAPPGYYMLFLINTDGVPSVAKILRVSGGGAITIPTGTASGVDTTTVYKMIAQVSNLCADVPNDSLADSIQLKQFACDNTLSQAFKLAAVTGQPGIYTIINQNSGKCMDARNNGLTNGTAIQQYLCNNSTAQFFRLNDKGGGIYELVIQNGSNRCVDITNGSTLAGAGVQIWDCNSTPAQRFKLTP